MSDVIDSPSLSSAGQETPLKGKRVVICEDEGMAQMQFRRTLERAGLQVVGQATNGPQAVAIVLKERPDIVLMDLFMPEMDGLEASRQILATYSVCIILLTGHDKESVENELKDIGISGYLSKPVLSAALMSTLPAALEQFCRRN